MPIPPRSFPLSLALAATVLAAVTACSSNGENPQIANTRLSSAPPTAPGSESGPAAQAGSPGMSGTQGASPSIQPPPPARCAPGSAAAVSAITRHLGGRYTLVSPRQLPTTQASQDAAGFPTTIVGARLTGVAGSPVGVWAVSDPSVPEQVLPLNAAADAATTGAATVSPQLEAQLRSGATASNVALCVRTGT